MIEAVEIPASDGVVLRGELRPGGADWVVLVHDHGEDLDAWRPLTKALARKGLSVLAYDLRGHGGSGGGIDADRTAEDLDAVLAFARRAGAELVVVGAAGSSVGPALASAAHKATAFFGLGSRGEGFPRAPGIRKLFVSGSRDPAQERAAAELERAGGWTVVARLPVAAAGLRLLRGRWRSNVEAYVLLFLRDAQSGPAHPTGMTDRCDIVRRFLAAFWDSRWDELMDYLADDALYVDPLLPLPVRGKDAIRDVLAYCHEWGEYRGEIRNVFGLGPFVTAELRIRGRVKKPPEGMSNAVVGKEFDFIEADVFELDGDGRIVRETIYADALTLMRQLGEPF